MRQEKQLFSEQWASVWPIGIMYFFGYRFVIVRVIIWNTWLDQKKGETMILRTLLLKILNAVLNKAWGCRGKWKAQTKRNRGKERNLEHPHCSCCKARPCSFISPAWRVVTGKSCARDRSPHGPPGTRAHGHAADPRAHGHTGKDHQRTLLESEVETKDWYVAVHYFKFT